MPWLFNYYGGIYVLTWSENVGYIQDDSLRSFHGRKTGPLSVFFEGQAGWLLDYHCGVGTATHIYRGRIEQIHSLRIWLYEGNDGRMYAYWQWGFVF